MVSGTISLFCSKCFSPFPHGTGSLSVSREYLALPDGPGGFTQNSSCSALLRIPLSEAMLRVPDCHCLWSNFPDRSAHLACYYSVVLQPHGCRNIHGLGSSPFARHYWGNHCLFSLPAGTKMFQFPAFASYIGRIPALQAGGLSHSEIRGSRDICSFPRLIAAYHVLHRLREPRHPPCALSYLSYRLRRYVARTVYTFSLYFGFKLCFCHIMSKIVSVVLMIDYVRLRSLRLSSNLHAVENNGFEPLTPCLQSRCSSQLS